MALPNEFANKILARMVWLDEDFTELGLIDYISCTMGPDGNNITLTPFGNKPAVDGYTQLQGYSFIATASNVSPPNARVGVLNFLPVYKTTASGPAQVLAGEIVTNNQYTLIYDLALNGGSGGFHLGGGAAALPAATSGSILIGTGGSGYKTGSLQAGSGISVLAGDGTLVVAANLIAGTGVEFTGGGGTAIRINASLSGTINNIQLGALTVYGNPQLASNLGQSVTLGAAFSFAGASIVTNAFSGDIFTPGNSIQATLSPVIAPGVYGSGTSVPALTVSSGGRILAVTPSPITINNISPVSVAGNMLIGTTGSGWVQNRITAGGSIQITFGDGTVTISANVSPSAGGFNGDSFSLLREGVF